MKIFLIEDQDYLRLSLRQALRPYGSVVPLSSYQQFSQMIAEERSSADLYIIDLDLEEELLGLEILKLLEDVNAYKLVLTGRDDQQIISQAYQLGANDYLVKPFGLDELVNIIDQIKSSQAESSFLDDFGFNTKEQELFKNALQRSIPIYLAGETGTGKTTLAKKIHELSHKNEKPFVSFNCSEFSENLMESELFGHTKGSFTGAIKDKKGRIELADGGTLFLDEVATMPMSLQTKLLKVIEEKEFYAVGSERKQSSDFKLISASCNNLDELVASGRFREDLYFRLKGINLRLRPLREMPNQIQKTIDHFLCENKRRKVMEPQALQAMLNYSWPGNWRELGKELEILRAKNLNNIKASDLSFNQQMADTEKSYLDLHQVKELGLKSYLSKIEKDILQLVLNENRGKVRKTLSDLKISSQGFYRIQKCHKVD